MRQAMICADIEGSIAVGGIERGGAASDMD